MNRNIKMVFCTQNMAPFRMRWVDEIAKYIDVHVYHLDEYGAGVNMKYINYFPKRAKVFCDKVSILKRNFFDHKKILDENADIYLLDGYGFLGQQCLMLELSIKRIPFIVSVDGGFVNQNENFLKKKIKSFLLKKPSAFLSTSKETDEFIQYYAGNNINIMRHYFSSISAENIRNCVDKEEKRIYRGELDIKDKFTVIAVGQFIPRKGFDILIKAVKSVRLDIQVYFVGASNAKQYDVLIDDEVREKIRFVDFCDEDTLSKYYCASDVFVLPTREDVWGLVIGEAMAQGLPIVTTNKCLAGMEMINEFENGFIVQSDNEDALAKVITYLYDNPDLCDEMGRNNLKKICNYSIEEATKKDIENFKKWIGYEG